MNLGAWHHILQAECQHVAVTVELLEETATSYNFLVHILLSGYNHEKMKNDCGHGLKTPRLLTNKIQNHKADRQFCRQVF